MREEFTAKNQGSKALDLVCQAMSLVYGFVLAVNLIGGELLWRKITDIKIIINKLYTSKLFAIDSRLLLGFY